MLLTVEPGDTDVSGEVGVGDDVDPEVLARPGGWDIAFVRRFMLVFGPISSILDNATFVVMIHVLRAGLSEFRTGSFVESIVTQTLVAPATGTITAGAPTPNAMITASADALHASPATGSHTPRVAMSARRTRSPESSTLSPLPSRCDDVTPPPASGVGAPRTATHRRSQRR